MKNGRIADDVHRLVLTFGKGRERTGIDRCGDYAQMGAMLIRSERGLTLQERSGWLSVGHGNALAGAYDWSGRDRVFDAIADETLQRIATSIGKHDDEFTAHCRKLTSDYGVEAGRRLIRVNVERQITFDEQGTLVHNHAWLTRTNKGGRVEIIDFSARHYPIYAARTGRSWHGEPPLYLWEWEDELPLWVSFSPEDTVAADGR
jgi:hypothetical protein